MIQFFNKKLRNRKGFTLIELIVVIAILGILAAIAIPRFSGFTNKAKIGADQQYASLVGNATVVLMAEGTLTTGGTLTIASNGTVTGSGFGGWVAAAGGPPVVGGTPAKIAELVAVKPLVHYTTMTVTITDDGVVSVTP